MVIEVGGGGGVDEKVEEVEEVEGGRSEPEEAESLCVGVQTHTLILPSLWPVISTLS
jgi:hypothetical protein